MNGPSVTLNALFTFGPRFWGSPQESDTPNGSRPRCRWPDSFVEEGNLTNNISTLRKTLGESRGNPQYIETVPKRGYRFIADVREVGGEGFELVVEKYIKSRIVIEQEEDTGAETEIAPAFRAKVIAAKPGSGHPLRDNVSPFPRLGCRTWRIAINTAPLDREPSWSRPAEFR
jgi:hypothetical protein